MVTMTVMYPYDADKPFDEAYFANTHVPLLKEVWGSAVKDVTVHHALAGLGGDPAFSTIVQVEFTSMEDFQKAMGQPRTPEVQGDVPNYAGVVPLTQLSRAA
jgi:uncharacterized protein (TIGR02118 family)